MITIGSNIGKFNFHVQTLMGSLMAWDDSSTDLLTNLFKGYAKCSEKTFIAYMACEKEDYKDGKDKTPDQTMQTADNCFKNQKSKNKWNVPSVE